LRPHHERYFSSLIIIYAYFNAKDFPPDLEVPSASDKPPIPNAQIPPPSNTHPWFLSSTTIPTQGHQKNQSKTPTPSIEIRMKEA
jgi:hypothetical protein